MIVRLVVLLALLMSGLVAPPAQAHPTASAVTGAASPAAGPMLAASAVTATKPRAVVSGSYQLLASGKVRVSLTSTATRVKLTWRTVSNKKRTALVKVRKGAAVRTLPKGSKKVVAQARATKKLRTGAVTPIPLYSPPAVTPPVVTPPVDTPPVAAPPSGPPPPVSPPPVDPDPSTSPPPADTTAPGPVIGLQATAATPTSITLVWDNPTDPDLDQIIVRRAAGATPPASPTDGSGVALATATATTATDSGLDPASDFSYAAFARDHAGNTSAVASVTTRTAASPDVDAPPPAQSITAVPGDGLVVVSWQAVPAVDLAGYLVYQGAGPDGPWVEVAGSPTTSTDLTVTGLANDTTLWFTVAARDTAGNTSVPGVPSPATPTGPPPVPVAPGVTLMASEAGLDLTVTPALPDGQHWQVEVFRQNDQDWLPTTTVQTSSHLTIPVSVPGTYLVRIPAGQHEPYEGAETQRTWFPPGQGTTEQVARAAVEDSLQPDQDLRVLDVGQSTDGDQLVTLQYIHDGVPIIGAQAKVAVDGPEPVNVNDQPAPFGDLHDPSAAQPQPTRAHGRSTTWPRKLVRLPRDLGPASPGS